VLGHVWWADFSTFGQPLTGKSVVLFSRPVNSLGKKEDRKIRYSQLEIQSTLISIYNKILSIDLDLILKMQQVLKIN
jgi:hypothetical protein